MELLKAVESISRQDSVDTVELALLQTLGENFSEVSEALLLVHEDSGWWVSARWQDGQLRADCAEPIDDAQLSALAAQALNERTANAAGLLCFRLDYASKDPRVLVLRSQPLNTANTHGLTILIRIVENFSSLLQEKNRDRLTGLLNRHQLEDRVLHALVTANDTASSESRAQRSDERRASTSRHADWLAIVDIDHFKRINDTLGHLFGDEVLLLVSQLMTDTLRRKDQLFRYGGEEFVLLLANLSTDDVARVLERFRAKLAAKEFPQLGHITVSIGYTRIGSQGSASAVLGEADQALYWSKQNGRDRVGEYSSLLQQGLLKVSNSNGSVELF